MKKIALFIIGLLFAFGSMGLAQAEDAAAAMQQIAIDVAALNLGFGEYKLGHQLTKKQKEIATKNVIEKSIKGSYKFQDDGIFVVASKSSDTIIGIYRQNDKAPQDVVQQWVGSIMLEHGEPTTMAHDRMIYWAFGKKGRLGEENFDATKQDNHDVLATIKFASNQPIRPSAPPEEKEGEAKSEKELASIYVMITSNQMSKIFLALNR